MALFGYIPVGAPPACAPPPQRPIFLDFTQFSGNFNQIVSQCPLANHSLEKSLIRHCFQTCSGSPMSREVSVCMVSTYSPPPPPRPPLTDTSENIPSEAGGKMFQFDPARITIYKAKLQTVSSNKRIIETQGENRSWLVSQAHNSSSTNINICRFL